MLKFSVNSSFSLEYMEEEEKEVMNLECPRKLNFNAPLLSTRHPIGMKRLELPRANSLRVSLDFCDRIPFSWEQTPGKPKDIQARDVRNVDFPPPKLPPCRWLPAKEKSTDCKIEEHYDHDDGFDGDVEDDGNDEVDQSDTIDIFSLGQSVDMVETGDEVTMFGFAGLEPEECCGSHSPTFIIQRFLPDAKALAASSAFNLSNNTFEQEPPESSSRARTSVSRAVSVRRSYPATKGCGINSFFPWRMKPKPCGTGTKNPVLATVLREKPQFQSTRREK